MTAFNCYIFSQKAPSLMFDRVLNTPLDLYTSTVICFTGWYQGHLSHFARSLLPQCGCNELDFIEATGHGQVQCRSFHLCAIQRQKRTIKKLRITNPPFHANIPFLYPLKTPENLFSDVFSGYRNETLAWNGLNWNFRILTRKI